MGSHEGIIISHWIFEKFQQRDWHNSAIESNDSLFRPLVAKTQRLKGKKNHLGAGILLNYNDDDFSQVYLQTKEAFKALTREDILQSYLSHHDFRSNFDGNDVDFYFYVFDKRYQKFSHQPNQLK